MQEVDDGIKVSSLGNCVVENDGSGVWIRPVRMTTNEMVVRTLLGLGDTACVHSCMLVRCTNVESQMMQK